MSNGGAQPLGGLSAEMSVGGASDAPGGDPNLAAGQPSGGAAVGGQPVGGAPVGGQPLGGAPVGGQSVGGVPAGGQQAGGVAVGGPIVGGQPAGGRAAGGAQAMPDGEPEEVNCSDADNDGTCDGRDLHCNLDGRMLTCLQALRPAQSVKFLRSMLAVLPASASRSMSALDGPLVRVPRQYSRRSCPPITTR